MSRLTAAPAAVRRIPIDALGTATPRLSRLLGWAKVVCACAALWAAPITVGAQEGQRLGVGGLQSTTSTPPLTPPERLSPESLVSSFHDDQGSRSHFSGVQDVVAWNWQRMLIATAAMVGAVLLSLPLAFIYLRTRPPHEFDSSVLFSIVFLSATIAGIMVVVQGSLARALSLAGVVGAVRFRSSLKDSNDAVYLLGAIAVGIAAGSNELDVGVVISVLLSVTLLLLWKARLDAMNRAALSKDDDPRHRHDHRDKDDDPRHGHDHRDHESTEPSVERSTSTAAEGNGMAPLRMPELRPPVLDRLGYIVVDTEHAEQTRLLVETFLEREAKSWRLDGASPNGAEYRDRYKHASGIATLMYLVRFRKRSQPEAIVERLKALGQSANFSVRLETGNAFREQLA